MDTKAKIKIIKRSAQPKPALRNKKKKVQTAQTAAREMVTTVSGWVNEFQQKRREETKDALNKLFGEIPNPGCANC